MTEQELRARFGAEVELPAVVEDRMRATYAQIRQKGGHIVKRKRSIRTLLVLAAVIAALGIGATGVYMATRVEVLLPSEVPALEGLFGNESRSSTSNQTWYYKEKDIVIDLPDEERVSLDDETAVALLKDYLPKTGYAWRLGEYTFTVESYLLDEGSGTGKIYYSLERADGLNNVFMLQPDGSIWYYNGEKIDLSLENAFWRDYVDQSRTSDNKLCAAMSFAYCNFDLKDLSAMKAEEGLSFRFVNNQDGVKTTDTLKLPGLKSLPSSVAYNTEGEPKVIFSAIGMKVIYPEIAEGEDIRYVALQYADGTEYVVTDFKNNIRNSSYELGSQHRETMQYCFNRLVDPAQVVSVTVDGRVYTVKQ